MRSPTIASVIARFAEATTPPFLPADVATMAGIEVGLRLGVKYTEVGERALASLADERAAIDPIAVDLAERAVEDREAFVDTIANAFRAVLGDIPMPEDDEDETDEDDSPVMVVITPISGDDEGLMFL